MYIYNIYIWGDTYMGDPLIAGWFIMEKPIKMDDMYTYIYSANILYLFMRLYTYVISTVTPSQAAYKATYPRATCDALWAPAQRAIRQTPHGLVFQVLQNLRSPGCSFFPRHMRDTTRLVVSTPLKNTKVSSDDYSQYMEK
jgi:hypothetical protein